MPNPQTTETPDLDAVLPPAGTEPSLDTYEDSPEETPENEYEEFDAEIDEMEVGLDDDIEESVLPSAQAEAEPEVSADEEEEPTEAPPEASEPEQPSEAAVPETVEPPADPEPAAPQAELESILPQAEPAQAEAAPQESFEEIHSKLFDAAVKEFTISEDDARQLEVEPEKVMPSILAKVYTKTFQTVMTGVLQAVPQIIEQNAQQAKMREAFEGEFFTANPGLDGSNPDIVQAFRTYFPGIAQANRNLPKEKLFSMVGAAIHVGMGIPSTSPTPPQQTSPVPPAPTTRPPGTGRAVTPAPAAPTNPFEAFDIELEREDM